MFRITVNDKNEYDVSVSGEKMIINNREINPDLVKLSETRYNLILEHKSYNISIVNQDGKNLTVEVNGNKYDLNIKDRYDQLLHDLGLDAAMTAKADIIKAPMPGLVVNILVKEGDEVAKDTPLLVLEAMKMENVLKATAPGIVDKIHVKPKDAVDKNAVLISFR